MKSRKKVTDSKSDNSMMVFGEEMVDCPMDGVSKRGTCDRRTETKNKNQHNRPILNNIPFRNGTRELFAELSKIAKDGTEIEKKGAREEACNQLEYFLRSIIKTHFVSYIQTDPEYYNDLMIAGQCGIIQSLPGYDPDKGMPTTYFYPRIMHEMVLENSLLKHGVSVKSFIIRRKMFKIDSMFEAWGRIPTTADYSLLTGESINVINNLRFLWEVGNPVREPDELKIEQSAGMSNSYYMNPERAFLNKTAMKLLRDKVNQKFMIKDQEIFRCHIKGMKAAEIAKKIGKKEDYIRSVIESCCNALKYDPDIREMFDLYE